MVMPRVADSLAGRMGVITMWPLSQGEIKGVEENFIGKRLTRSPKVFLSDTGLACYLLDADPKRLSSNPDLAGRLFETFVVSEILKQVSWAGRQARVYHFRSPEGREVDVVLEDRAGNMVGIEIKLTASPTAASFSGLKALQELAGKRFRAGILLYTGKDMVPFGKKLAAIPVSALWKRQA